MAKDQRAVALQFQETTFDLVDHVSGEQWLRSRQIAGALGYAQPDAITDLYNSNAAEFTDSMTALVKLPTAGGQQEVRIFSLRGAHLLGMFARTERAAEFRRWVLDVLERQSSGPPYPPTVIKAVQRLMLQGEALRRNLLELNPKFKLVMRYHAITELTQAEKARLMGLKTAESWRDLLHQAAAMGLIDWEPNAAMSLGGRDGNVKRRINHNGSPEHMKKMREANAAKRAAKLAAAKKGGAA